MNLKNGLTKYMIAFLLISGMVLFLVTCSRGDGQEVEGVLSQNVGSENDSALSVEIEEAQLGTLSTYINIVGETKPYNKVDLIPRLQEEVEKIKVGVGDIVAKGDILLELNSDDMEIEVEQARASLAAAEANLQEALNGTREEEIIQLKADLSKAKSDLEVAKNNYERYQGLYEEGFISKKSFEQYLNEFIAAKSSYQSVQQALKIAETGSTAEEIKNLQAQVDQAKASLDSAELNLSRTMVKAPIAGVISSLDIEVGEQTTTSSAVLTISQLDKIRIKAYVSQSTVNKLKTGDLVNIYLAAIDKTFGGKIKSISPVADESKKSFPLEIVVENPEQLIKAGMYAEVKLRSSQVVGELVIPQSAIIEEDGNKYLYIVNDDNRAERIKVETGLSSADEIVILSGLTEGERVVVTGAEFLKDGTSVKIVGQGAK